MKIKGLLGLVGSGICIITLILLTLSFLAEAAPPKEAPGKKEIIHWRGQADFSKTLAPFGPFKLGHVGVYAQTEFMLDWITKATNGRLKIDFEPVGTLNPPGETFDMVRRGVYPVAFSTGPFYVGKMPETDIEVGLVFAFRDMFDLWDCYYNYGVYEELKRAYAEHKIYWIPVHSSSNVSVGATVPLDKPERLKGKKIRALGQFGDYIAALGGTPVHIPLAEVYMGLKLGTVDGFVSGVSFLHSQKWSEVCKHFVLSPSCSLWTNNMLINLDAFKALPKDIQQTIDYYAPYVGFAAAQAWRQQDQWVINNVEEKFGIKFYTWSAEDTKKVTKMVIDQVWPKIAAKSPRNARMIDLIKRQMRDHGRID